MRKVKGGSFSRGAKKIFRRCAGMGKRGLLVLLALLLAIGPAWPAFAEEEATRRSGAGGLFDTVGAIFESAGNFIRDEQPPGRMIPDKDIPEALAALEEFSRLVLKDPRLAEIIDSIILEIVTDEGIPDDLQNSKQFIADIIRDPRLIQVIGEIITDYLQDERFAEDIKDLFGIIFELIADEELHYYVRDTLAALVEHESLERTINDVLKTGTGSVYQAGSVTVADLLSDKRLSRELNKLVSIITGSAPEMISVLLVDERNNKRVLRIAEEILLIFALYGAELPLNLMDDVRLRECMADLVLLTVDPQIYAATASIGKGLAEHLIHQAAAELTADEVVEDITADLIYDFFKADEAVLQEFFQDSLTTLIARARSGALESTPSDETIRITPMLEINANIQKSIAENLAMVPPQIVKLVAFDWLVDGNPVPPYAETPGLAPVPRTYEHWGREVGGLLNQNDRAADLAAALSADLHNIIDHFLMENGEQISDALRDIIVELPLDEAAAEIRSSGAAEDLSAKLAKRIITCIPLEELAHCIFEEADITGIIGGFTGNMMGDLPFKKAARLVAGDRRILKALEGSLPHISLAPVAHTIRHDDRLIAALADAASDVPVGGITEFIQDGTRADLIGQTLARLFLTIAADFVEDEQLAVFLHLVLLDAIDSLEGTPGALILDSLARFFENEDFAGYLVDSLYDLAYGVDNELWHLYKQVVPRFFTYALWKLL